MPTVQLKNIEIFRAGKYPQGSFAASDLSAIANRYDPAFLKAPNTVDHAQTGPAFGYVTGLRAEGDLLFADVEVEEGLADAIKSKKVLSRSVEFFRNLEGKGPYLKALSWLGAQVPQVKGMSDVDFSAFSDAETDVIEFSDTPISENQKQQESQVENPVVSFSEYQALKAQMDALTAKFAEVDQVRVQAEERLRALNMNARRIEFEQYLNERVAYGDMPPALKNKVLKVLLALDSIPMFADQGEEFSTVDAFKEILGHLPKLPKVVGVKKPAPVKTAAGKPSFTEFQDAVKNAQELAVLTQTILP